MPKIEFSAHQQAFINKYFAWMMSQGLSTKGQPGDAYRDLARDAQSNIILKFRLKGLEQDKVIQLNTIVKDYEDILTQNGDFANNPSLKQIICVSDDSIDINFNALFHYFTQNFKGLFEGTNISDQKNKFYYTIPGRTLKLAGEISGVKEKMWLILANINDQGIQGQLLPLVNSNGVKLLQTVDSDLSAAVTISPDTLSISRKAITYNAVKTSFHNQPETLDSNQQLTVSESNYTYKDGVISTEGNIEILAGEVPVESFQTGSISSEDLCKLYLINMLPKPVNASKEAYKDVQELIDDFSNDLTFNLNSIHLDGMKENLRKFESFNKFIQDFNTKELFGDAGLIEKMRSLHTKYLERVDLLEEIYKLAKTINIKIENYNYVEIYNWLYTVKEDPNQSQHKTSAENLYSRIKVEEILLPIFKSNPSLLVNNEQNNCAAKNHISGLNFLKKDFNNPQSNIKQDNFFNRYTSSDIAFFYYLRFICKDDTKLNNDLKQGLDSMLKNQDFVGKMSPRIKERFLNICFDHGNLNVKRTILTKNPEFVPDNFLNIILWSGYKTGRSISATIKFVGDLFKSIASAATSCMPQATAQAQSHAAPAAANRASSVSAPQQR